MALPPQLPIGDIVNNEQLEEQIRKIVAQGMAGRVPAFHTAKRIMELVNDPHTEPCEECGAIMTSTGDGWIHEVIFHDATCFTASRWATKNGGK